MEVKQNYKEVSEQIQSLNPKYDQIGMYPRKKIGSNWRFTW